MRSRHTIAASIAASLIASGADIGGARVGVEAFNDFRVRFNPRNPAPMPRRRRFKQNKRKGL